MLYECISIQDFITDGTKELVRFKEFVNEMQSIFYLLHFQTKNLIQYRYFIVSRIRLESISLSQLSKFESNLTQFVS